MLRSEGIPSADAPRLADLADQIWAAYTAGEPYVSPLAQLCALCEEVGLDHAEILDDAARRAPPTWHRRSS